MYEDIYGGTLLLKSKEAARFILNKIKSILYK